MAPGTVQLTAELIKISFMRVYKIEKQRIHFSGVKKFLKKPIDISICCR